MHTRPSPVPQPGTASHRQAPPQAEAPAALAGLRWLAAALVSMWPALPTTHAVHPGAYSESKQET